MQERKFVAKVCGAVIVISRSSFFSSRRRHTRSKRDWSSDVCSSDLDDKTMTFLSCAEPGFSRATGLTSPRSVSMQENICSMSAKGSGARKWRQEDEERLN